MNQRLEFRRQELEHRSEMIHDVKVNGENEECSNDVQYNDHIFEGDTDEINPGGYDEEHQIALEDSTDDPYPIEDDIDRLELEEHVLGLNGMSSDAKDRLFKSRLEMANKELDRIKNDNIEKSKEIKSLRYVAYDCTHDIIGNK
jgi:hypothetical protein